MKAAVRHTYGPPSVIRIEDRPRPEPGEGEVLIRVAAAAANPLDWHFLRGAPRVMRLQSGLRRPKEVRLGQDVAGVIEAVGPGVTRWAVGDEVLGSCLGAYAEHAITGQDELVAKPAAMSFAEAAGLPVAGSTALQGLRDHCRLSAGQRVLITGAGGGVGHLAVQIAHAMGAHVTAVCSTGNVELVRSLGADVVVHSSTKYLGGHSDVVGGALVVADDGLADELRFHQNAMGSIPGPFDSWLVLRGAKTLAVRMERHCDNAEAIVAFLDEHPAVAEVLYPGRPDHPGHAVAARQMRRFGGMVSFRLVGGDEAAVRACGLTQVFTLAESLGGVESLIEHPARMTHASVAGSALEVPADLVRLSVGIETLDDLRADLDRALSP